KDFNAQKILVRMRLCNLRGGLAHAKSDLKDDVTGAAKGLCQIEWTAAIRDRPLRQQPAKRPLLAGRNMRTPVHKAADVAVPTGRCVRRRGHGLTAGLADSSRTGCSGRMGLR